jgi:anti-anti-sigma factor
MEIQINESDGVVVVSINGEVDAATSETLQTCFNEQLANGKHFLVADMQAVLYMSSAGFRVLLGTMKSARKDGGDLRLSSVHGNVYRVLQKSGFDQFMKFFKDTTLAVKSFDG